MSAPKIVLLGMLTKIPVGGVAWLVTQYLEGFRRLGFDPYYVEAHARTPSMLMADEHDDATACATAYLDTEMRRIGMGGSWAFQALHDDGAVHGPCAAQLPQLYRDAALVVNLHGGTVPREEHASSGRLVLISTDPVELELELHRGEQAAIDFVDAHAAHFTWGLNHGNPDCLLPWSERVPFVPSPPPVVIDLWDEPSEVPGPAFTTVGNWRQDWRPVTFRGEVYHWSKHREFLHVLDLPSRVDRPLELALSSCTEGDRRMLESHGWAVRPGLEVSADARSYRDYLLGSRGEFSVAKDQNVRLRSGWFSERSTSYLAAGRPVVVQDTGFGNHLPVGEGLFAFRTVDEAAAAIEEIDTDHARQCRAAREIARDLLDHEVVLGDLLARVGLGVPARRSRRSTAPARLPGSLDLTPIRRRPLQLSADTERAVLDRPIPAVVTAAPPALSVVMVTHDNLAFTRMALESVLAHTCDVAHEVVVVDNASTDGTAEYLSVLAARSPHVRVLANTDNRGFAPAANQGIEASVGDIVVLLNNDTIVTEGWAARLAGHLADGSVGAVGPVTNRCGNAAEVAVEYRTHAELLDVARQRSFDLRGRWTPMSMLVLFCAAFRRHVLDEVGLLDERFEVGMFEDDDLARRILAAGYDLRCAEDVFVHHFGEASFSKLYADGTRSGLFEANRRRFEDKWGEPWQPHERRRHRGYEELVTRVRDEVDAVVPGDAMVAVITKGDDQLLHMGGRITRHFPSAADGTYAGHHPGDDDEAIAHLRRLEREGLTHLVVPEPSYWWLEHYAGLRRYLDDRYRPLSTTAAKVYERSPAAATPETAGAPR